MRYAKVFITALLVGCASSNLAGARRPVLHSAAEPRLSYAPLLGAAKEALAQGHADAAAALAEDACRQDPNRPDAYLVRGQALAQNDHVEQSSTAFERARALGCRDVALFSALASNYDVEHRYLQAQAIYEDYLGDHPHDASMRGELALTLLLLGEPERAVLQLRRALRDAPSSLQIRQDLGYALLATRSFAEAETQLAEVCQAGAAAPEAFRLWAQALAGQRKWEAALRVVDTMLARQPLDRDAQTLKAQLQARLSPQPAAAATADDNAPPNDLPDASR